MGSSNCEKKNGLGKVAKHWGGVPKRADFPDPLPRIRPDTSAKDLGTWDLDKKFDLDFRTEDAIDSSGVRFT